MGHVVAGSPVSKSDALSTFRVDKRCTERERELRENTWKKFNPIEHPHRIVRSGSVVRGTCSDKETFIYSGKVYIFVLLLFFCK